MFGVWSLVVGGDLVIWWEQARGDRGTPPWQRPPLRAQLRTRGVGGDAPLGLRCNCPRACAAALEGNTRMPVTHALKLLQA